MAVVLSRECALQERCVVHGRWCCLGCAVQEGGGAVQEGGAVHNRK